METVFIYALNCPSTGRTRYIGKASNPYDRYCSHLDKKPHEDTRKARWLRSLRENPVLEILDEVPTSEWQFWEREWIRLYRVLMFDLVNGTDGGDGASNVSLEARQKRRDALLGKKRPPEICARISAGLTGLKHPASFKEMRRKLMLGTKRSAETIQRMQDSQRLRRAKEKLCH